MNTEIEKYLIEGSRPLVVIPELAYQLGIEAGVVLQQLHYLLRDERNGKVINGKRWIYNSYEEWQRQYFPWMSAMSIRRAFVLLEKRKMIESCQPEGGISRRKYYRMLVGGTAE